jgi:hypothetical protein
MLPDKPDENFNIKNNERHQLIHKKFHGGGLTSIEEERLKVLQLEIGKYLSHWRKPMFDHLAEIEKKLGIFEEPNPPSST